MDSFAAYQRFTRTTAIYPGAEGYGSESLPALRYLGLGLVGESGEIADKVKKIIRDNDSNLDDEQKDALLKEAGDVLWYAARLVDHLGTTIGVVVGNPNLDSFGAYQGRVIGESRALSHPDLVGTVDELNYLALLLCSESGKVAVRIAARMIGGLPLNADLLSPVLHTLTRVVVNLGGAIGEVASDNVRKLSSRKDRDVLAGSGDNR